MIEVERDLIEGARLAITTQICVSIWSSESKDKQALLVNQYILPNDLMLLFVQNNYAFAFWSLETAEYLPFSHIESNFVIWN